MPILAATVAITPLGVIATLIFIVAYLVFLTNLCGERHIERQQGSHHIAMIPDAEPSPDGPQAPSNVHYLNEHRASNGIVDGSSFNFSALNGSDERVG